MKNTFEILLQNLIQAIEKNILFHQKLFFSVTI